MKNYFKKLSYIILSLTLLLGACEVEESLTITKPDAEFTLESPGISNVFLNFELPDNPAFTITWIDEINTGATYTVELSLTPEFDAPIVLGSTEKDNFSISVTDLNTVLDNAGVTSFSATAIYIRLNTGDALSNDILFQVSKFAVKLPELIDPTSGNSIVLSDIDPEADAVTITFNDPEITATSTVDVTYELQMAEAGTDFATFTSFGEAEEGEFSFTLQHGELNDAALTANGAPDTAENFEFRLIATAKTDAGDLFRTSETLSLSITPYNVALAPILYVVGAGAADAGWDWATPVELVLQGKKWSGNINLVNDAFRFFTANGDWGSGRNYPWYSDRSYTIDSNLENAADGDQNFRFTGTPGEYFIEIDTENKTITLGPPVVGPNCNFDQLWVVGAGAADAGWDWATPVKISCTGTGVYEGNINLINDAFRFFTANGDWGSGRNYPYYVGEGFTIDSRLEDAMDGDNNFRFTGTPGEYGLTIDTVNKTIMLSDPISLCEFDQLWLVGAATPGGWDWAAPTELPCTGAGVYSGSVTLANDAFRFFTANGDWGSGLNFPYYTGEGYTIDANFEDALDGDNNFRFIGTPGTYNLTVDTVNRTITLN